MEWDWSGDGTYDAPPAPLSSSTHSYSTSGTRSISLRVSDGAGRTHATTRVVTVDDPPTPCFTGPSSSQPGSSVTFDAGCSGDDVGVSSFRWDFNLGSDVITWDATGRTVSTSYQAGAYTVLMEATDSRGQQRSTTRTITVTSPPAACAEVDPPTGGTTATTFIFDAACSTDDMTSSASLQVRWDFRGDGAWTAWTTAKTAQTTFAATGTYSARVEVKDESGFVSQTTRPITVSSQPIADTQPPLACFSLSTHLAFPNQGVTGISCSSDDRTSSTDLRVRWDWRGDGQWTDWSPSTTAITSYSVTGTYTINFQVRDLANQIGSATDTIVVNSKPTACFTPSATAGTTGTTFTFDPSCSSDAETPQANLQIRWDYNGVPGWDTPPGPATPFSTKLRSGENSVNLQVTDAHGHTTTTWRIISVNDPPVACAVVEPKEGRSTDAFVADASCSTDDRTTTLEYRWDWDGDALAWDTGWSRTSTAPVSPRWHGDNAVIVQVRDGNGASSVADATFYLNDPPQACFTVGPAGEKLSTTPILLDPACSSDDLTAYPNLVGRWDWEGDGGWDTDWTPLGATSRTYGKDGWKTPTLLVRDSRGLQSVASVSFQLIPDPETGFADAFDEDDLGWTATGLWHMTNGGEAAANVFSGSGAYRFGRSGVLGYETTTPPYQSTGTLTSPTIDLTGITDPTLTFASWHDVDAGDLLSVSVSTDGGATWRNVDTVSDDGADEKWTLHVVRLVREGVDSPSLLVRFEFASDAAGNAGFGWYVDEVRVFQDLDQDGLSYPEEVTGGTNPADADTDDDTILDVLDVRPLVEDIPPQFPKVTGPVGEFRFYTDKGFGEINLTAPVDNAAVAGVEVALRLRGNRSVGDPQTAILRIGLTIDPLTSNYVGRFPIPSNFQPPEGTTSPSTVDTEEITIVPFDVNGNRVAYVGLVKEPMTFSKPWSSTYNADYERLQSVRLAYAPQPPPPPGGRDCDPGDPDCTIFECHICGQSSTGPADEVYTATRYLLSFPTPTIPTAATVDGVVLAEGEPIVTLLDPGCLCDHAGGVYPLGMQFAGTTTASAATVAQFGGGVWNVVWEGITKTAAATPGFLDKQVHGFIYGSDENGGLLGDVVSGLVVYGDVRDVALGLYEGDDVRLILGGVGLGLTFAPWADAAFSTAKPSARLMGAASKPLLKTWAKEFGLAARTLDTEGAWALVRFAVHTGADPGRAQRLALYANKFPDDPQVLTRLAKTGELDAIDTTLRKYADAGTLDTLLTKLSAPASLVKDHETFAALAKADADLAGRNVLSNFASVAHVSGIDRVANNLARATPGARKGYAFEAEIGAKLETETPGSVTEFVHRLQRTQDEGVFYVDDLASPTKVCNPCGYEMDIVQAKDGQIILHEVKDRKIVGRGEIRHTVLGAENLRAQGRAHQSVLWVRDGNAITEPAKAFAAQHGTVVKDLSGNILG